MQNGSGLYIDSVACSFAGRRILNGVYLQCQIGEVVGLLGRNGSGKSTLLKIIFGSQSAEHKHIKLNGQLIRQKGYLTNEIVYLPQDHFLPNGLKLQLLVDMCCPTYRNELIEIDLIRDNLDRKMLELSGGNRRAIACLLIIYSDAHYILLDEPFSQIAPLLVDQLQTHIQKFQSTKGFIITDHYYERILEISSRVVLIHNGANYQISNPADLHTHGYIPSNDF